MPPLIYFIPDALLVILSCWLGLSLLVRAPGDHGTRVFAWFCTTLVLYGLGNLLPQLTASPAVAQYFNRLQVVGTLLSPTVFLHFILVLSSGGYLTRPRRIIISVAYTTAILLSLYAAFGPLPEPAAPFPPWSRWGEPRLPTGPLAWGWTAQRVLTLLVALGLMGLTYRQPAHDQQERRMRYIFGFISLLGVTGALGAVLARELTLAPALPRAMIVAAMMALAYAVLTRRALLPDRVARRTFIYSLLGSLLTTFYVGLVILLEALVDSWLHIEVPLIAALSLVVIIATLEPLREWLRRYFDQRFYRREFNYVNLVRSLGDEMLEQGNLEDQLQAALSAICRALGIRAGFVIVATTPAGLAVLASYGKVEPLPTLHAIHVDDELHWLDEDNPWPPWPQARLLMPLRQGEDRLGLLVLAEQYIPQSFSQAEYALLDYLNNYLSLVISHAHARDLQQDVIVALAEQGKALRDQQEQLAQQALLAARQEAERQAQPPRKGSGLHVYALGPLRVERGSETITRWGGSKAGTYQAEALFAFLFDRRGKGLTKDEAAEVIWPDLPLDKADTAFHRTLAALRRTLEPGLKRGNLSQTILYHHERYWLEPSLIAWSDSETFQSATESGLTLLRQGQIEQALHALEQAHQLYRGDYMDDCPFYGDSASVEEQRSDLRLRFIDVQLALGAAYEEADRIGEAASAYRRALALSPEGCPTAEAGLQRLHISA